MFREYAREIGRRLWQLLCCIFAMPLVCAFLGISLNWFVMNANGGTMPVVSWDPVIQGVVERSKRHHMADEHSKHIWLADWIEVKKEYTIVVRIKASMPKSMLTYLRRFDRHGLFDARHGVGSIGDLFLMLGFVLLPFSIAFFALWLFITMFIRITRA